MSHIRDYEGNWIEVGAGSLTVTDGVTSVEATTLHAPGVTEVADGQAAILSPLTWDPAAGIFRAASDGDHTGAYLGVRSGYAPYGGETALTSGDGDQNLGPYGAVIGTYSPANSISGAGASIQLRPGDSSDALGYTATKMVLEGGAPGGIHRNGYIILTNLPTTDPGVAGALYSDSGTVKVSAG